MAAENEIKTDKKQKTGLGGIFSTAKENIKNTGKVQLGSIKKKKDQIRKEKEEKRRIKELSPMAKAAPGNVTGTIFLIFGLIFLGIVLGFGATFYFVYHRSFLFVALVFFIPLIFSIVLLLLGIKQNIHAQTYANYRAILRERPYASIQELSESTHQTDYKTCKNLKTYSNEGLFPQGFFTDDNKYFVLSEGALEILQDKLKTESKLKAKEKEIDSLKNNYPHLYKVYQQVKEVRETVTILKERKTALKKPQLEDDLMELDYNLKQIQTYILVNPGQVPDLHNFLDYFLPMVTKLLDTYCELDKSKIRTKNIIESQNEIEDVLKTVNGALKRMYNDFYSGTAMDVYSDIQVLKSMIQKQGFNQSDFKDETNE